MTCKTHLAAAAALSLVVVEPTTIPGFIATIGAATLGGAICDLDVVTSDSHKYVDIFTILFFLSIVGATILEHFFHIGVLQWIRNYSSYKKFAICFVSFLIICFFGMHQAHRSFLHSIVGMILLSGIFYIGLGSPALPFAVGMSSHIILDLLNKKGIQLYYPIPGRYALKLYDADGLVNNLLFVMFIILFIIRLIIICN